MKAIKFNTGRTYTPEGQVVIAYQVGEEAQDEDFGLTFLTVRFVDVSRMVSGEVTVTALSERQVMTEYDNGRYKNIWIDDAEKAAAIAAVGGAK